MAPLASAFLLLLLLQPAHASRTQEVLDGAGECGREVAEAPGGKSLQEYFDAKRVGYGILSASSGFEKGLVDPATCTKKDVCLLMRQLDMDFYARAREGKLTDHDYDQPPTIGWYTKDNCNSMSRGYRAVPVTSADMCRAEASKKGAGDLKEVSYSSLPTGCVVVKHASGKMEAFMNTLETDSAAGMRYYKNSAPKEIIAGVKYYGNNPAPKEIMQLCVMDRSLSEAAAAYYSPYKLKPSMEGREAHSTSCSFGMMAFLSQLRETMSPCARIITYRPDPRFHSAAHALQMAASLEKQSPAAADKIRQYVETMRQKYVLLDTISNRWCPGVWTAAKEKDDATCSAPRVMAWTEEGKRLQELQAKKSAQSGGPKSSAGARKSGGGRKGGRRPADGGDLEGAGNAGLLEDLDALLAELESELEGEDLLAKGLGEHHDPDGGLSDSRGKPIKVALNDASCEAFGDETLAERLVDAPAAPPDFFQDAKVSE